MYGTESTVTESGLSVSPVEVKLPVLTRHGINYGVVSKLFRNISLKVLFGGPKDCTWNYPIPCIKKDRPVVNSEYKGGMFGLVGRISLELVPEPL